MNVGQSAIDSVVAHGQPQMVETQQMQNRGVDVVDLCWMFPVQWLEPPLVRLSVGDASANSAAAQPVGEHVRVMVAARCCPACTASGQTRWSTK